MFVRKIYVGENWAMGDSGGDDVDVIRFYHVLQGHKNYGSNTERSKAIIEKAIEKKSFVEINELNAHLMKKNDDIESTHRFIFAVNKPSFGLWMIDEFGNFKEHNEDSKIDYVCIGRGEDKVKEHISEVIEEDKFDRDNYSIVDAIKMARGAMVAAEKDIYTGMGYNLTIITQENIKEWGKEIKKELRDAEQRMLKKIEDIYADKKQTENTQA